MRFSEHFDSTEFQNLPLNTVLKIHNVWCLEQLRARLNLRLCYDPWEEIVLIVTSGVRTPEENERVGGVRDSNHLEEFGGHALDVVAKMRCTGEVVLPDIVAHEAEGLFDFILAYSDKGHVHVDQREKYEELTG